MDERGVILANESLWDRISALRDIISPTTRDKLSKMWQATSAYGFFGGWIAGKLIWIGVTSALVVGLPFALAVEDESRFAVQEKEIAAQQQGAGVPTNPLSPPGVSGQPEGLRPPGF